MAERTIPIVLCRSIDEVLAFSVAIGFEVTYQQQRPTTLLAEADSVPSTAGERTTVTDDLTRAEDLRTDLTHTRP